MEVFYYLVFGVMAAVVAALEMSKRNKDQNTSSSFNSFKNNYILVFSIMMAGDWLQGPYVYYLYSTYGFGKRDIVLAMADVNFFFAFLKNYAQRNFDQQWLSLTISKAVFFGNGLVAILSGLFGNLLVDIFSFGPVAPFDAASCFLAIGIVIILTTWSENFGDPSDSKDLMTQFKVAAIAIASGRVKVNVKNYEKIALLGAIQSLFEASMYTFVFLWTPALSPNNEEIPHGFVFATFMLASMLGSSLAARLMARSSLRVEKYMQIVFLVSAASLLLPITTSVLVTPSKVKEEGLSLTCSIQLLGFCVFEACIGIFSASIMKMRSLYIPEEARSTIMNFFRVPLNLFVCIVLYNVDTFPITIMFGMCSIFIFVASILQRRLMVISENPKGEERSPMKERDSEVDPLLSSDYLPFSIS
ncbi:hypothetical protein IGI04_022902 [Brassica rapa subsp. trilocularis]|uniref:Uncharacterized protein n=1 Tax=Brassica rapa subsp. trilocularis TaxID=1813537 RepID=A0ABQ7M5Q7_BRACM|nr:hypothetical protein IGI04_022902 [Brassica rapa subsp. trilocularis]